MIAPAKKKVTSPSAAATQKKLNTSQGGKDEFKKPR